MTIRHINFVSTHCGNTRITCKLPIFPLAIMGKHGSIVLLTTVFLVSGRNRSNILPLISCERSVGR